ncbi:MAG TPA: hypothetical protein VN794_22070 [Methylomirabilota bacterium]|nr:hypothetical protein [Methylomirabilota bacterium]
MIISTRLRASALAGLALAAVVVLCIGCGQGSVKLSSSEKKAFDQASPEVKQAWENVQAAEKANEYLKAVNLFDSLSQMQLTEPQKEALIKEREGFNQRLWQAAEKNDAAAVQAVQASQKSRSRMPPAPGR